jgi:hypothetical protein
MLLVMIAAGCLQDVSSDAEDSADDSFTSDGKADGTIAEGSATALAVLAIVNTKSEDELVNQVGLATRVAHNIASHDAHGAQFTTLAELDAIPYVGKTVFARLVAYAKASGGHVTLPKGKLLDCNTSLGPDQQVTVKSDGASLTLEELTSSGSFEDRPLSLGEWTSKKLRLRSDELGTKSDLAKDGSSWVMRSAGPGISETGVADCWVDKSH